MVGVECGSKECEKFGDETDKRGRRSSLGRRDLKPPRAHFSFLLSRDWREIFIFPRRFTGSTLLNKLIRQSVSCDEEHDRLAGKEIEEEPKRGGGGGQPFGDSGEWTVDRQGGGARGEIQEPAGS
jgi:hypothetical protein